MTLFPLFANLKHRAVLVIGGGEIAERKVRLMLACGARVTVVAPHVVDTLQELARLERITLIAASYQTSHLNGAWLIIAATDQRTVNQRIAQDAQDARILVNVVDDPELSSFQVPAIVDRSPLIIAISSTGSAPMLARRVREQLETMIDHSVGALARLAHDYRSAIRRARPELGPRRRFYDWLMDGPVGAALRSQQGEQARQALEQGLHTPESAQDKQGRVILVGAGPGDPGLLTLNALRALNRADVILYDRLVSDQVMELARRDATRIFVGKQLGEDHHQTQARIHGLMVEHARAGHTVVRLKGGDGFIFGRGGEELEYLAEQKVAFEVVPGITAAVACAAYSGIPLTHRDHAQSVQLVTAHRQSGHSIQDWNPLLDPTQTVAVYMGLQQILLFCDDLLLRGRDADTPCALVENGSRPEQRTLLSTLQRIARDARQHDFKSPAILIIGQVAALGASLSWYGELIDQFSPYEHQVHKDQILELA
ncbi:siroheme synthase CysG [Alcaligenes sp. SDU_A2]|uniref:siroheme synthase CysG n=1 Tax=Alcaligenes sp. SDU_A2 TaxID=3136634 RepID=UPI002C673899|nr:siroheme synthase CysG [Alcaligenes sp.]HRL27983.1 siroheme synthase CysG [Alcaligenes sp.]